MGFLIYRAKPDELLPKHLLLLADEHQPFIDAYLPYSQVYILKKQNAIRGICVLQVRQSIGEIMNIAVEPVYQGQGLGKALLSHVEHVARQQGLDKLVIKTGNSSIGQMALYQRYGFDLASVNFNHFLNAYPEPIWENGIQCKHQLVFEMALGRT